METSQRTKVHEERSTNDSDAIMLRRAAQRISAVLVHLHGEDLRKKAFIRVVQIRERADFEHPNGDIIA